MFDFPTKLKATAYSEAWKLARPFKIARESFEHVDVVIVEIQSDGDTGYGECCPVPRYGESVESVLWKAFEICAQIESADFTNWRDLHNTIPAGAARNAVDCAMWDLLAKSTGTPVWQMLDLPRPSGTETVFTISLDDPAIMAAQAGASSGHNSLKIKLGSASGDMTRLRAVREAQPTKRLIIDANEGWTREQLDRYMPVMAELAIEMVEQPLPAQMDHKLRGVDRQVPIGADESCHTCDDLEKLAGLYDVVNIKLDKTGGLSEAAELLRKAQAEGFDTMVGCMLGTSMAMAPALLLAPSCKFVDLDAPLLIGADRSPCLRYADGAIRIPEQGVWGGI